MKQLIIIAQAHCLSLKNKFIIAQPHSLSKFSFHHIRADKIMNTRCIITTIIYCKDRWAGRWIY